MIRDFLGSVLVVIGAMIFQLGFLVMTKEMQDRFATRMVYHFLDTIEK